MYICSHKLNITLSEKQGVEPVETFQEFISHFLYELFFYTQFINSNGNEIEKSITTSDDKIKFSYIITLKI